MKVLQVITTTSRRGAEVFAVRLGECLARQGLEVSTVALVAGTSPPLAVDVLGTRRLGASTIRRLRSLAKESAVVVAHGSSTLPATAAATLGLSTPFVYRNIGDPAYWGTSAGRRLRTRVLLHRAASIVALNDQIRTRLIDMYRLPPHRVVSIPTGIDPDAFPARTAAARAAARRDLGIDDGVRLAVCVGALSPEKAVHNAVLAMADLPDRWHLLVAGDGAEMSVVDRAAVSVGRDKVRLLGQVSDPARLLTAADVLVLPSLTEGVPAVVLEAAFVGVPTVATRVGFVADLIDDGLTGLLVDAGSPGALTAGLERAEPDLVVMGQKAAVRAGPYALPIVAERWRRLIGSLAGRDVGTVAADG